MRFVTGLMGGSSRGAWGRSSRAPTQRDTSTPHKVDWGGGECTEDCCNPKMVNMGGGRRRRTRGRRGLGLGLGFGLAAAGAASDLRFQVGDQVLANVGEWKPGVIIKLWDMSNPYRIRLESGHEIWGPQDTDEYVRAP